MADKGQEEIQKERHIKGLKLLRTVIKQTPAWDQPGLDGSTRGGESARNCDVAKLSFCGCGAECEWDLSPAWGAVYRRGCGEHTKAQLMLALFLSSATSCACSLSLGGIAAPVVELLVVLYLFHVFLIINLPKGE